MKSELLKYNLPILILILIGQQFSFGQKQLSLEDCIRIAQKNNLDIKETLLSEREATLSVKYAKHQLLPSLNANSSFSYNIGRGIDPITNSYLSKSFFSQGLNLNTSVTLYNGEVLKNRIKEAKINAKALHEDYIQIKRDIALAVADIYLSILYNEESIIQSQIQRELTKKQLDKTTQLVKEGEKLISEVKNLEAQLLFDEEKIISIKSKIENGYQDLKSLMLVKSDFKIKIPNIDILNFSKLLVQPNAPLFKSSIQNNNEIEAANLRILSAMIQKKIAKASILPLVKIGGSISTNYSDKTKEIIGYEDTVNQQIMIIDGVTKAVGVQSIIPLFENQSYLSQIKNNWGIGLWVQISIPIYNNYSAKAQIQRAKINLEQKKIAKQRIVLNTKKKVQKAYSELKNYWSKYLASKKSSDAQKMVFDIATKQYNEGIIGIYDFLKAKSNFEQSKNRLLISKYQYIFKTKILDFYLGKDITLENK